MCSPLNQLSHRVARLIVGLLLVTAAATGSATAAPNKFQSNGRYISMWATDASGCVFVSVSAARGGATAEQPQTFLNYYVWDGCAGTYLGWGYGVIPNADLVFKGKTATLTTAPSASAIFAVEGTPGALRLTARANGVYSTTSTGQWRTEYPGVVVRSKGTSTYTSADATGDVLGLNVFNVSAEMGSNRQRVLEIVQER